MRPLSFHCARCQRPRPGCSIGPKKKDGGDTAWTYEIGPDAGPADDVFSTRNMDNDYVLSLEYLALARGAMHYMRVERIDLLVVGLPVSIFALKKATLEKRLTGSHDVGGKKSVVKKVRVLAQPHGALMNSRWVTPTSLPR